MLDQTLKSVSICDVDVDTTTVHCVDMCENDVNCELNDNSCHVAKVMHNDADDDVQSLVDADNSDDVCSIVNPDEYKKLHSLQSLVRTNHRTKTANITNDDATSASHRQKVTVLQK